LIQLVRKKSQEYNGAFIEIEKNCGEAIVLIPLWVFAPFFTQKMAEEDKVDTAVFLKSFFAMILNVFQL